MYKVDYFTRRNGECPCKGWLEGLERTDKREHKKITAILFKLEDEGLKLVNTEMMSPIKGVQNMYEVRSKHCRTLTYYNEITQEFIVLHGFRKKHRVEPKEIDVGCSLLREYLEDRYGGV